MPAGKTARHALPGQSSREQSDGATLAGRVPTTTVGGNGGCGGLALLSGRGGLGVRVRGGTGATLAGRAPPTTVGGNGGCGGLALLSGVGGGLACASGGGTTCPGTHGAPAPRSFSCLSPVTGEGAFILCEEATGGWGACEGGTTCPGTCRSPLPLACSRHSPVTMEGAFALCR